MSNFKDFMEALKEDPDRALANEFQEFLEDFLENKKKGHLDSFLDSPQQEQEQIVQEFLRTARKNFKATYQMPMHEFIEHADLDRLGARGRFEDFLSKWTKEDQEPVDNLERFAKLDKDAQEGIFAAFQEDELPDVTKEKGMQVDYHTQKENDVDYASGPAIDDPERQEQSTLVELTEQMHPKKEDEREEEAAFHAYQN